MMSSVHHHIAGEKNLILIGSLTEERLEIQENNIDYLHLQELAEMLKLWLILNLMANRAIAVIAVTSEIVVARTVRQPRTNRST